MPNLTYTHDGAEYAIDLAGPHVGVTVCEPDSIWHVDYSEYCETEDCNYNAQPVPVPEPPFVAVMCIGILALWFLGLFYRTGERQ